MDCVLWLEGPEGVAGAGAGFRPMLCCLWRSLQSGATLIYICLDVGPPPPRSSSPTVAGCQLGWSPVGCDLWGGDRDVVGVLPRINIGTWGL